MAKFPSPWIFVTFALLLLISKTNFRLSSLSASAILLIYYRSSLFLPIVMLCHRIPDVPQTSSSSDIPCTFSYLLSNQILMMYSPTKMNSAGDTGQPWRTPWQLCITSKDIHLSLYSCSGRCGLYSVSTLWSMKNTIHTKTRRYHTVITMYAQLSALSC